MFGRFVRYFSLNRTKIGEDAILGVILMLEVLWYYYYMFLSMESFGGSRRSISQSREIIVLSLCKEAPFGYRVVFGRVRTSIFTFCCPDQDQKCGSP